MTLGDLIAEAVVSNPSFLHTIVEKLALLVGNKISFDDSPWDGSASQWDTAEAYCSDCLIDLNESGQPKIKDKCKLPYRKSGSSEPNLGALRAIASGARGLSAVNAPPEAKRAAAKKVAGWWRAAFKKDPPPSIQRAASGKGLKSVTFFKDSSGEQWFFGIYSNKWEDRDVEILSSDSHQEYADWVNKSVFEPVVTLYHQPSMPDPFWQTVFEKYGDSPEILNRVVEHVYADIGFARVKHVAFFNGFATVLAKVLPEMQDVAEKLAAIEDLGMSHGFIVLKFNGNVLERYRTFEMSVLKRNRAANTLTTASIVQGEDIPMATKAKLTDEDRKVLAEVMGADRAANLEVGTKEAEEILDMILNFKATDEVEGEDDEEEALMEEEDKADASSEPDAEVSVTAEAEVPAEVPAVEVLAGEVKGVFDQIATSMSTMATQIESLTNTVAQMEKALAEKASAKEVQSLKQTEDEKIAAQFLPSYTFGKGYSPSQDDSTVISEEEAKQEKSTGPTGERGQVDPDNVLQIGLWDQVPTGPFN